MKQQLLSTKARSGAALRVPVTRQHSVALRLPVSHGFSATAAIGNHWVTLLRLNLAPGTHNGVCITR